MNRAGEKKRMLRSMLISFLVSAVFVSFSVSVSFMVFFNVSDYTETQMRAAAPYTFYNVIVITLLFTGGQTVWRYLTVERPVRRIQTVLKRITNGDFSVRLKENAHYGYFSEIADSVSIMTEELESVETLKTDFLAAMTHELKTPLSVIKNYGQLLHTPNVPEDVRLEYAQNIVSEAGKMNDMIVNFLRLNRLEHQTIAPKTEIFDLGAALSESVLRYENVWEEKNIRLELVLPDGIRVRSYREMLDHIWNNLLSNAFKFTPENGKVGVSLSADGGVVTVSVSDTGCGFDEKTSRHIFDQFYQGEGVHAEDGNGLGLAIAKRALDIVGGSISVESAVGRGSCFTVMLPRDFDIRNKS